MTSSNGTSPLVVLAVGLLATSLSACGENESVTEARRAAAKAQEQVFALQAELAQEQKKTATAIEEGEECAKTREKFAALLSDAERKKNDAEAAVEERKRLDEARELLPEQVVPTITLAISERKPSGAPWDGMGDGPDVAVEMKGPEGKVKATGPGDRYNHELQLPGITLKKGDEIVVSVIDRDFMEDDAIGKLTFVYGGPDSEVQEAVGPMRIGIKFQR